MKIQPYMIDIEYDHHFQLGKEKTLPILQIQKVEPVRFDIERDCWYTQNHFRRQVKNANGKWETRMLQIGIAIEDEDLEGVLVYFESQHDNESKQRQLLFHPEEKVWYELSRFKKKKEKENFYRYDNSDSVSGIAHAGYLEIVVKKNGITVERQPITFYPSAISMEDYEVMVSDLFRIRENLVRRNKTSVSIGSVEEHTVKQLQKVINQLEAPINAINANPASTLSFRWETRKPDRGEKFRIRTEIDKEMNIGKNKYQVFNGYENLEMEENKMIKQQLVRLKNYCEFYQASAPLVRSYDKQKINEMRIILEKGSKRINGLIGQMPIEQVSTEDYNSYIFKLSEELQKSNQKIKEKQQSIIHRLRYITPLPQIKSSVPIIIKCTINSVQFIKDVRWENGGLTTLFSSGWTGSVATLEYEGYEYNWNGNLVNIPPSSYFLSIENKSHHVRDHWMLWKAFHHAVQDLSELNKSISIEIHGNVKWRHRPTRENPDIIGEAQGNSGFKKYMFELTKISKIRVEEKELEDIVDEEVMHKELADFLLEKDREFENLETKRLDIKFDTKSLESIQKISNKRKQQEYIGDLYQLLASRIDEWLSLPLFSSIDITGIEHLKPTHLFMHDPYYSSIWNLLHDLQEEIGLSIIPQSSSNRFGIQKVEQLFESWILFKMIHLLTTEMGWTLDKCEDVVNCLDSYILTSRNNLLEGFKTTLRQREWSIELAYEPVIKVWENYSYGKTNQRKPDFVFRIYQHEVCRGIIYLDAKHRNYNNQGEVTWKQDIELVAIEKYGSMIPISSELQQRILGSFLIHSDAEFGMNKEMSGENYFAFYNRKQFPDKINETYTEDVHKYGSIYLLPSAIHAFKNWFRLMMEFRIGFHQLCWNCGCNEVEVEERYTLSGFPKYYYTCSDCGEFWIKNHCTKHGHKIVKHFNNYHRQVSSNYKWYIVCPTCGDGFSKEDQFHHRGFIPPNEYAQNLFRIHEELPPTPFIFPDDLPI